MDFLKIIFSKCHFLYRFRHFSFPMIPFLIMNIYKAETEVEYQVIDNSFIQIGTGKPAISTKFNETLTIPNRIEGKIVTILSEWAFANCTVTVLKLPDTITTIKKYCFRNCRVERFVCPNSVVNVQESIFRWARTRVADFRKTKIVKFEGSYHFASSNIRVIFLPETLVEIPGHFAFNSKLNNITITKNVKNILHSAFACCSELSIFWNQSPHYFIYQRGLYSRDLLTLIGYPSKWESDILPTIKYIDPARGFSGSSFPSFKLNAAVEKISDNAFRDMKNLVSIDLSRSKATSIGRFCFHGCIRLNEVILPETVKKLMPFSFTKCPLTVLILPDNVETAEDAFTDCAIQEVHYCGSNAISGELQPNCIVHLTDYYPFHTFMGIDNILRDSKCVYVEKDLEDVDEFMKSNAFNKSPKNIKEVTELIRDALTNFNNDIQDEINDEL